MKAGILQVISIAKTARREVSQMRRRPEKQISLFIIVGTNRPPSKAATHIDSAILQVLRRGSILMYCFEDDSLRNTSNARRVCQTD